VAARQPLDDMTIRAHLLLLALAAVVPVLGFALVASVLLVAHDRETRRAGAVDSARAMMTAVDAELSGSIATLRSLSASRALAADDLAGFYAAAGRVLATQPGWLNVTLARPTGEVLVNVAAAPGATLGVTPDKPSLERVAKTAEPTVGDLITDEVTGAPGVPVRVPVVRGGAATYVLSAIVRPDAIARIIQNQDLPADWYSGVVDRQLRFVARVPRVPAGSPASASFQAAISRSKEGWYRGLTVEGTDTFTAHKTSSFSGWSIGVAIPTATVEAAARRSAWLMVAGALVSIALAFLATLVVGRRIASPIRALASAAHALDRGEEPHIQDGGVVQEVSQVAAALREAASAVRERELLMNREKEALQAADLAKDEFLAMLSHELRNPLAALSSAAHLLKVVDAGHPAAARARAVIDRQTRHMTRLIEDLLDVSRIRMGKASLERKHFDLAEAVFRVVEGWRSGGRLGRHPVELVRAPVWIDGDRERVEQIVSNLLDNAVKFTPAGGTIAVSVGREGDSAVLRVADRGEGIAPELIGRVFDLFVQGEQLIDRGKGGMGIGLSLVKRLSEMHGGTVSASSGGRGQGATFTVRIPAVQPVEAPEARPVAPAAKTARRVLIIEDNDDAREMLRTALAVNGHQVQDARDGASGLAAAAQARFDVALIDIGLPDMNGYEVARRLRASADGRVRLIALTGYGQSEDRRRAEEAGFDLHLTKPVDSERLEAVFASLTAS
jgi:signal transduction histidine kinase